jgi:hypothetical protein
MTYPRIDNLPLQVNACSWTWRKMQNRKFWIGQELNGTKWLVKGRGSFYALRERASGYFLQTLGVNSQSSAFVVLPEKSLPVTERPNIERCQLAISYIDEHDRDCVDGDNCLLRKLRDQFDKSPEKYPFLETCAILNIIDWVKSDVLACLCGANEPSGRLLSKDHIMYVIDNEHMLSQTPVSPIRCTKWFDKEYDASMELTLGLCKRISKIKKRDIQIFTAVPDGYVVDELWSISELMESTVMYSKKFLKYNE